MSSNFAKKKKDKNFLEMQNKEYKSSVHLEDISDGVSVGMTRPRAMNVNTVSNKSR